MGEKIDKLLSSKGIPHINQPIYRVTANAFHKAIVKSKKANVANGWMVDAHTKKEYKSMKTYLTRDGKSGIAVLAK